MPNISEYQRQMFDSESHLNKKPNVGEVERQDGEPCGCGHPDCRECNPRKPEYQPNHASADRVLLLEDMAQAVKEMLIGVERWANDEDGIPEELAPAYLAVKDLLRRLGG